MITTAPSKEPPPPPEEGAPQRPDLEARCAELAARNAELVAKNTELVAMNAELARMNAQLLTTNTELVAQMKVLVARVDSIERENAELKRKITGRTTEGKRGTKRNEPPPRKKNDAKAQEQRRQRREERKSLPEELVDHPLGPNAQARCPECAGGPMTPLAPECSTEFEWTPGRLVRRVHRVERAMCERCKHFERAPSPRRVVDGGHYGPGFIARIVVNKLLDCVPLYRQCRALEREGLHVARSTLVDLFHLAASLIEPIYLRMLELVPTSRVVYADETSLKMQRVKKLAFIWTFATTLYITYVFSPSRSGATPVAVLGDSKGVLVVDGYTGYNKVTVPGKRVRAGCNAHGRRKFAHIDDPIAQQILDLYQEVFEVERRAKELGIHGTAEHLALRQARAGPAMRAIKTLCDDQVGNYPPKSAVGAAIRYIRNQWVYLTRFLEDVGIDPDNNLSERLLRIIALGRKNYLFVGHEEAGRNSAMLASILATCVLHGVNPIAYLTDVLIRVQTHPASEMDDLLPHRWKVLFGSESDSAKAA